MSEQIKPIYDVSLLIKELTEWQESNKDKNIDSESLKELIYIARVFP